MPPIGYHLSQRLVDRRVIAQTAEERRLVARVVLELGRHYKLLVFGLAHDHLHSTVIGDRARAGRFTQALESSLKQRLGLPVGFVQYDPEPIRDARHLANVVPYNFQQYQRHKLPHVYAVEGSSAPDLLGMRVLGRYTRDTLRRWLPNVRRDDVLEWVELSALRPADGPLERLREATRAASGVENLGSRRPAAVDARRAMLEVVGDRLSPQEAGELLGVKPRSLRWLRSRDADLKLVHAIRLQLGYLALG